MRKLRQVTYLTYREHRILERRRKFWHGVRMFLGGLTIFAFTWLAWLMVYLFE